MCFLLTMWLTVPRWDLNHMAAPCRGAGVDTGQLMCQRSTTRELRCTAPQIWGSIMALPGENRLAAGSRSYIPASTTEGGATACRMTRQAAPQRGRAGERGAPKAIVAAIRDTGSVLGAGGGTL